MITGDNPLTACFISQQLLITRRPTLILDSSDDVIQCQTADEAVKFPLPSDWLELKEPNTELKSLISKFDFCVTGDALKQLHGTRLFTRILLPRISVYARSSPLQKEYVLAEMKHSGYTTLMCGDGTNDVGALKQAHVGVALLDGTQEDLEKIAKTMRERRLREIRAKQEEMMKSWGVRMPDDVRNQQQKQNIDKLMNSMQDMDDVPVLKFGDASVAAPFTSKLGTVESSTLYYLL